MLNYTLYIHSLNHWSRTSPVCRGTWLSKGPLSTLCKQVLWSTEFKCPEWEENSVVLIALTASGGRASNQTSWGLRCKGQGICKCSKQCASIYLVHRILAPQSFHAPCIVLVPCSGKRTHDAEICRTWLLDLQQVLNAAHSMLPSAFTGLSDGCVTLPTHALWCSSPSSVVTCG